MHITIMTVGSRGDIQPFVALGGGLRHAGYAVRLATHAIFEPMIRAAGLEFAPVEGNPQAIVQGGEGQAWLQSERNPVRFARGFRQLMGPVIHQAMQDGLAAAAGTDAIIVGGPAFYFAQSIAQKLGVPYLQAYLQPIHPTTAFPSALFPTARQGGRLFNYFTHIAAGQLFWQIMRPVVNDARRRFLGLPPQPLLGPFPEMMRQGIPALYGYSPALLPKPADWRDWIHVVGYWFLDQPGWEPPAALADFLAAGPPPVYIGFGSMHTGEAGRMTEIAIAALRRAKQRGLLLAGWGGLRQSDLPDDILMIDQAPHDWLFPRMAAVVHHGGAGTTGAGLRAGRPTVIIPFFGDQPFWGRRVYAAGAGPRPLVLKDLSVERLADAIVRAVGDNTIRARATALGQRIRAEDGLGRAAEIATRYLLGQAVEHHV
jgi:UDP:flavonoid glycosyltransferase YjiC (YdhE family)